MIDQVLLCGLVVRLGGLLKGGNKLCNELVGGGKGGG